MTKYLLGEAQRFLRQMDHLRFVPQQHRREIAAQVFRDIQPYLDSLQNAQLRLLRRHAQDQQAVLLYHGARDFRHAAFAAFTLVDQWANAKIESLGQGSSKDLAFAKRRVEDIEEFVRNNLHADTPDDG